ncbi:MAG: hypothetical protein NVSMB51_18730 [Solirubrobacteraceae bacterium]
MSRRAPRGLGVALEQLTARIAPRSTLAEVQRVWDEALGAGVAAHASPLSESGGVLMVGCESAVWAQELDLLGPQLVQQLNTALGRAALSGLRCRATGAAPRDVSLGR